MEKIISLTRELLNELEKNGYSTKGNVNIMEYDDNTIKLWNIISKKQWTINCGKKETTEAVK